MPKGDKYLGLTNYLKQIKQDRVELSFEEIENILKFTLPDSARKHQQWWSNSLSHSQAYSWINAEYNVESTGETVKHQKVIFIKI